MSGRKNTTLKASRRKTELTPKQNAKDSKVWACGRKVMYMSEGEAQTVATKLRHRVYLCSYSNGTPHWHTAHLPGSQRFARFIA
jgi:hypothetical protein